MERRGLVRLDDLTEDVVVIVTSDAFQLTYDHVPLRPPPDHPLYPDHNTLANPVSRHG